MSNHIRLDIRAVAESDTSANNQPKPGKLWLPKLGASRRPKEEIERSEPYAPKSDQVGPHRFQWMNTPRIQPS